MLYGLGGAGSRQEGDELPALIYLRLSLYLRPADDLTEVTLANLFEQMKRSERCDGRLSRRCPRRRRCERTARSRVRSEYDGMGKTDEAIQRLSGHGGGAAA